MTPTICQPRLALALTNRFDLQLSDVSFRYSDRQGWALKKSA